MHRGYTAERYLERLAAARAAIADLAVTTDIIVGFPGETDDDFERTLEVVAEAAVRQRLHVHLLAPTRHRGGRAWPTGSSTRRRRGRALRAAAGRRRALRAGPPPRPAIGRIEEVLVEGPSKKDPTRAERAAPGRTSSCTSRRRRPLRPGTYADGRGHRRRARTTSSGELVEVTAAPRHRTRIPVRRGVSLARWRARSHRCVAIVGPDRRRASRRWPWPWPRAPSPDVEIVVGRLDAGLPGHGHRHGQADARPSRPRCRHHLHRPRRPRRRVHRRRSSRPRVARRSPTSTPRGHRRRARRRHRPVPPRRHRRPRAARASGPRSAPSSRPSRTRAALHARLARARPGRRRPDGADATAAASCARSR